ncbi:ABC-2 transporter permease [uncultured Anaerococcus sp.]|uniref:ABC-2 transporter permease n=1 Tax=uncultured Anaerococcus sp. TaxID=293428 RepID=UPI00288BECA6|nr:ABC-2 transporter permease [uncultured Anaerococcus sp.]
MNINKQIKLDIISIKPYLTIKNFAIMTFIPLFYMYIMDSPVITLSMAMVFGIIFSSYPFLLGENAGIDGLYRIFGISSKELVIARYIMAYIIFISVSIFGIIYYLFIALVKDYPIGMDIFEMIGINFLFFTLMICFQYPIYFKYGYAKARTFGFLPILIIGILGMVGGYFIKDSGPIISFVEENQKILLIGLIILVILFLIISIKLAIKFYKKRDF